jgi:phosphatidylglycerol:prolipoprotein diacylglycerol transferase
MLLPPDIDPVALRLGPLRVHWYGVMYVVGFLAAWWLARRRAAKPGSGWSAQNVDDLIFWSMLGVIVGGRLGYVFFYGLSFWKADPFYPFRVWDGGMSFHGGLIGVLVALALFARRRGKAVLEVMDFTAPIVGLGIMAVRIGNFINGELWGRPTDLPWAFGVPAGEGGPLVGRHPSQLYEAALEGLALFLLLWWFSSKPRPRGAVVATLPDRSTVGPPESPCLTSPRTAVIVRATGPWPYASSLSTTLVAPSRPGTTVSGPFSG